MATHNPASYCELYWFVRGEEILYVGISHNARYRWTAHRRNRPEWLAEDGVFVILVTGHRADLAQLEMLLIERYAPIGNISRQIDSGASPNTPPCPHGQATSRCQACKTQRVLKRYHTDPEYRARADAKALARIRRRRAQIAR